MKAKQAILWICRIIAALILLQTLFFKFSGAEESVYIFTKVHMEPWGRIGVGVMELIAGILLLIPRASVYGAVIAIGLMLGAIAMHLFILGIEVMNDGGQLFIYALLVLFASIFIVWTERFQLMQMLQKRRLVL
ncbi:MauE/DoxX family redox-associated membrane protein [Pollutibacter soli]|uniref:MauE/DoxX family redox-associated membrane protein n=1 Tax=Pollutibacter soli TaxID=3034157 RepID=UPI0030138DED